MRRRAIAILLIGWLFAIVTPASAEPAVHLTADLDGKPIAPSASSGYYCHDFDYPRIHCFRSAASLETAVGSNRSAGMSPMSVLSAPAGTWVTVYSDASYAGSWAYLSHNYDKLGDIGWNDIISSYRVQASFNGRFTRDTFGAGWQAYWYAGENIPYVGSTSNDQFSSFYRL